MTAGTRARCPDPALLLAIDEEGVIEPALQLQVRQHLAECAACRQTASALRETLDVEPSPEVRAHIEARLQVGAAPRARIVRWALPISALAAAAVILLAIALPDSSLPGAPDRPIAPTPSAANRPTVFRPDLPIFVAGGGTLAMRSEQSDREVLLATIGAALDDAGAGRYPEALAKLTEIERAHPESADVLLAVGTTHLLAGRPAEAIAALERGRTRAAGTLADEFDWHLSVAFVMAGTSERARSRLVAVCEHGGPRSAVACAGLAEVGRRPAPIMK